MFVSVLYILRIVLTFVLPSLNQHSMHYLSYSKSRCLSNTPTRFGARCLRPSESAFSNINFSAHQTVSNNCPNMCCRIGVFTRDTLFVKLQGGRWNYVNTCHCNTHNFEVLSVHYSLYCRSSCAVVLRTAVFWKIKHLKIHKCCS